jgi:polyphosphate glucokinase
MRSRHAHVSAEIERKFLLEEAPDVRRPPLDGARRLAIEQTYLLGEDGATERVRLVREEGAPERYFHTTKRPVSALTRQEDEREVDRGEYLRLLARRDPERGTIRKTRHVFPYGERTFELDVFEQPPGLVLLEVELPSEDAPVALPPFGGLREVSGDDRYANAELARQARDQAAAAAILVVDVGGSHVKALVSGESEPRRFDSGPTLTAREMVDGVLELVVGWSWDVVSVGIPTPVRGGKALAEPVNLGDGWVAFDYEGGFAKPTKLVNDAAMQAIGSYTGGRMLFLGLGTGLGSALIVDGVVEPLELGHLPFRKKTFEDYVSERARKKVGTKKWKKAVFEVVERLTTALEPDEVVLGGGAVDELDELPPRCRRGDNENAFLGGFRLWDPDWPAHVDYAARM